MTAPVRPTAPASAPTRRALLIGINAYTGDEFVHALRGCVNDVLEMQSVLQSLYAFEHVRVLVDEQATRQNILDALDALVEETGTDDIVMIQYSGHGSQ